MDQVKAVLAVMKKQAFWILISVVVLTGLGVWFVASAALAKHYEERKTALDTKMTTVSGIRSAASGEDAEHPNEEKIQRWGKRVDKNRVEATKAWKKMYRDQKLKNQWPSTLSPEFRRMIATIGLDRDIPNFFLDEYQNFIKDHFPAIDKIIDRRKAKKVEGARGVAAGMEGGYGAMPGGSGGEMGGYGGEMGSYGSDMGGYGGEMGGYGSDMGGTSGMGLAGAEMEGIVEWDNQDYSRIQAGVYWATRPLTVEVRLAQEDLWVYEALLRSIAKTNEEAGATSYYNAAIKRIRALEIGKPAAMAMRSAKSRLGLGKTTAGGAMGSGGDYMMEGGMGSGEMDMGSGGMMGGGEDDYMMEGGSGMMGSGGMMGGGASRDPEMVKKALLNGRYVDLTGEPLTADSEPYAEFKLMPVHIVVDMDQQKLPNFLVNLANCEMPVDVKQVSIAADGKMNFSTGGMGGMGGMGGSGGMMGGYGGDMGGYGGDMGGYGGEMGAGSGGEMGAGYGGEMGGYGGEMGSGGGMGAYGGGVASAATDDAKQDVPIEVLGVIRIFNPPDEEKLGTGGEAVAVAMPTGGATPVPGGAAPVPGGAAPVPGGAAPVPGGAAPVPGGAAPVPGGAAPVPGGAAPVPGGAAPVPSGAAPTAPTAG